MIEEILADAKARAAADVSIIGHTDTVGDAAMNVRLGMERARWVAALLRRHGLAAVELTVTSHGEVDPLVPTPDGTDEARNRRVEVIVR
jgi:outer membrane protein OmpA-like peptidoglycan-associated protein